MKTADSSRAACSLRFSNISQDMSVFFGRVLAFSHSNHIYNCKI
ncbi:hypothetical protein [Ruminococcus sp. Marseille-P6503]|nr:hypothetical protein [Ruminococcus sp. Marseille-P6503]